MLPVRMGLDAWRQETLGASRRIAHAVSSVGLVQCCSEAALNGCSEAALQRCSVAALQRCSVAALHWPTTHVCVRVEPVRAAPRHLIPTAVRISAIRVGVGDQVWVCVGGGDCSHAHKSTGTHERVRAHERGRDVACLPGSRCRTRTISGSAPVGLRQATREMPPSDNARQATCNAQHTTCRR